MLFLKWFASRTVRHAWQAANHVEKIFQHQCDLLNAEGTAALQRDIEALRAAARTGDKAVILESLAKLEKTATKWLKPYPHSALRENIEVALVAVAVAMGIRTFFLQPFKIPTGSMQPTLYGVTDENLVGNPNITIPNPVKGFLEYWFNGVSYKHVVAKAPGAFEGATEPTRVVLFNLKQTLRVGGQDYTIWFPPDNLVTRAGLVNCGRPNPHVFTNGEDILKLRIISGDHLFVDRVTYNFRKPRRGDIVVFETHGITTLAPDQQDTYYIKRLAGLGGETLQLKKAVDVTGVPGSYDNNCNRRPETIPAGRLVVNGKEITAATPHFEHLYSFPGVNRGTKTMSYQTNHYHGHGMLMNLGVVRSDGSDGNVITEPHPVPPNSYFVMGDNTFNSSDSRYWGDFNQNKVIGKSFFVYWPIGGTRVDGEDRASRFGWAHR